VSFYYRDTFGGLPTITVDETPSSGLTAATQAQTINGTGGPPHHLALTGPASVAAGCNASAFTVTVQDVSNTPVNATAATIVSLTGGGAAEFYTDSSCTTPAPSCPLGVRPGGPRCLTVANGAGTATFYYKNAGGAPRTICRERKSSSAVINLTLGGNSLRICAEPDAF
jgi:hypothetical protein